MPVALVWGRADLATPLAVAQAASARHGWPLHVIEDCADDPPVEQPEALRRARCAARSPRDPALEGRLLRPGDDGFAEATLIWNGMIEKTPALVVQPAGTADVVARRHLRPRGRAAASPSAAAATTSPAARSPRAA